MARASPSRDRAHRMPPGVVSAATLDDDLRRGEQRTLAGRSIAGRLALALASYHETFGMPMVEAMACGTPVLASCASSLPEIGGEAALYLPPHDAAAWAEALRLIVADAALRDAAADRRPRSRDALQLGSTARKSISLSFVRLRG